MTSVLLVGMAVMDFIFYVKDFPEGDAKYRAHDATQVGGGGAANAAVAVARLGGQAHLASRLGEDAIGDMIRADLMAEGIDLTLSDFSASRSSYSSVLINGAGERQIVNYRGADLIASTDHLRAAPDVGAVLTDTRWTEGAATALRLAQARGVPGVLDVEAPVDPVLFAPASHLAFSEQGLASVLPDLAPTEAIARIQAEFGGWVCVTLGANGIFWCDGATSGHLPAFPVDVVDTLAAGDVWHGAFALALAEGKTELDAMRFASGAAGLKCTRPGGRAGSPTRAEVETFLARL